VRIGTFAGLEVSAKPSVFGTYFVLAAGLAIFSASRLKLRAPAAVGFGIAGVLLHVGSVFVHHLGHALAALLVGYPNSHQPGVHYAGEAWPRGKGRDQIMLKLDTFLQQATAGRCHTHP
jgi:hypothetical protein